MAACLVHLDVPLLTVNAQGGLSAFPYKQKLVKSARTKGDRIVRVCLRARLLTFLDCQCIMNHFGGFHHNVKNQNQKNMNKLICT